MIFTISKLFFFRFSLASHFPNTVSRWLVLVRRLKSMIGLDHNHRLIWCLLLIFESTFLHHLVVDDPVVVDYSAVFALLTRKKANQTVFFDILLFPYISLFGLPKEARSTCLLCYFWVTDLACQLYVVLGLSLWLQDVYLIMQSIIDPLVLLDIKRGLRAPRNLSISERVHVGWLFWFSFSLIHV